MLVQQGHGRHFRRLSSAPSIGTKLRVAPVHREDIILRWVETEELSPADVFALETSLNAKERAQALKFRYETDRKAYVAAHGLVRALLCAASGRPAPCWQFETNELGKPAPVLKPGEPDLRISLSHTWGLAVVALSIGREIGVDAECLGRSAPLEIVQDHFSRIERARIEASHGAEQQAVFFALWTLKEAYVKARSRGLSLALSDMSFDVSPARLRWSKSDPDHRRWQFWQSEIGSNHIAALAIENPAAQPLSISAEKADLCTLITRS